MESLGMELQIILSGELEAAERLNQHLKTQATLIRHNKSKEIVASMREATELAEILNHYESQRIRWMQSNGWNLEDIFEGKNSQKEGDGALRKMGMSLKQMLREVFEMTVSNAEALRQNGQSGASVAAGNRWGEPVAAIVWIREQGRHTFIIPRPKGVTRIGNYHDNTKWHDGYGAPCPVH